jgi:hypothetical protein
MLSISTWNHECIEMREFIIEGGMGADARVSVRVSVRVRVRVAVMREREREHTA